MVGVRVWTVGIQRVGLCRNRSLRIAAVRSDAANGMCGWLLHSKTFLI